MDVVELGLKRKPNIRINIHLHSKINCRLFTRDHYAEARDYLSAISLNRIVIIKQSTEIALFSH